MLLFWRTSDAKTGFLSNWYAAKFKDPEDGAEYANVEQYMMRKKALLMGDNATAAKIMATTSAPEHKALGRKIRPWDETKWIANRDAIVYCGNWLKYTQNPALRQLLLDTGDAKLAEASPYDRIWGIGLLATDSRAQNAATWRGENRLGLALERVRHDLQ